MNSLNIDSLHARFVARRATTAAVSITGFQKVTPTLAKVVISHANLERLPKAQMHAAIASAMGNRARPVAGSFRRVQTAGLDAAVGFVALNQESKPYVEKEVSRLRVLAKNMLMDETDDSLWDVRTTAGGDRMLCRQVKEDISELLVTASVHVHRAPRLEHIASVALAGDIVSFVDPQTEEVRAGIVIASEEVVVDGPRPAQDMDVPEGNELLTVLEIPSNIAGKNDSDEKRGEDAPIADRIEAKLHTIDPSLIVTAATLKERFFSTEVAAPTNAQSKDALVKYYTEVYSYGPEFLKQLIQQIKDTNFA